MDKLLISRNLKKEVLGLKFDNVSLADSQNSIISFLSSNPSKRKGYYVVTPNPEFVVEAREDKDFQQIINDADLSLPDGVGIVWASKVLGETIDHRTTGADLVNLLLETGNERGWVFFFLGGKEGVAKEAAVRVTQKYPKLKIGCHQGEPGQGFDESSRAVLKDFARKYGVIDIILVAYGQNKQEKWIVRNLDHIPVRVAIGVGGALDLLSGRLSRAPKFVQGLGLEWLYRLIQEPWRWRRQLALPKFVFLVLEEKFFSH